MSAAIDVRQLRNAGFALETVFDYSGGVNKATRVIGFWVFLLSGGLRLFGFDPAEEGMTEMKELVRKRFPEVKQLSTADLAGWLADTNRARPLLVDVRRAEEFAVSRLPEAVRVDPDASAKSVLDLATNRPVVVYCSVGYRSSALADRLRKAGATRVFNLEGSLFQWANEDRPMVNAEGAVKVAHPYSRQYETLLKPEARADLKDK